MFCCPLRNNQSYNAETTFPLSSVQESLVNTDPSMHSKFHLQVYQIGYVHPAINATTVIAWNLYNSFQQPTTHWLCVLQKLQIVGRMTPLL
jgi:hypothetical protein